MLSITLVHGPEPVLVAGVKRMRTTSSAPARALLRALRKGLHLVGHDRLHITPCRWGLLTRVASTMELNRRRNGRQHIALEAVGNHQAEGVEPLPIIPLVHPRLPQLRLAGSRAARTHQ